MGVIFHHSFAIETVAQPKSFGMTAGDTRAGLDAVIAGIGDAAAKVDA